MGFLKQTLRFVCVFFSLMLLFFVLLVGSYVVPTNNMQNNLGNDIPLLVAEGVYSHPFLGDSQTQGDNFTEALALSMTSIDNRQGLVKSAMLNEVAFNGEYPIESLSVLLDPQSYPDIETYQYGVPKYWNGVLVFLKPMMALLGYKAARIFCFQAMFLMFVAVVLSIRKKLGSLYALLFSLALVAVRFFVVPGTVTMVFPWLVTFAACLVLLSRKTYKFSDCLLIFMITGCCVNFFDYMLTVIYGLGIPLVILFSILQRHQPQRNLLQNVGLLAGTSVAYFMGFGLSWAFKWGVSSIVTGQNVFKDAIESILWRSETLEGTSRLDGVRGNYGLLLSPMFKAGAAVVLLGMVVAIVFFHRKTLSAWLGTIVFALIALYPSVWYLFASNHSMIHGVFVYRYTVITVLAVLFGLANLIDMDALKAILLKAKAQLGRKRKNTI